MEMRQRSAMGRRGMREQRQNDMKQHSYPSFEKAVAPLKEFCTLWGMLNFNNVKQRESLSSTSVGGRQRMVKENYARSLGTFIRQLRQHRGLTQAQLGERVGVSHTVVSRWEAQTAQPPDYLLETLAEVLGCTVLELLNRGDYPRGLQPICPSAPMSLKPMQTLIGHERLIDRWQKLRHAQQHGQYGEMGEYINLRLAFYKVLDSYAGLNDLPHLITGELWAAWQSDLPEAAQNEFVLTVLVWFAKRHRLWSHMEPVVTQLLDIYPESSVDYARMYRIYSTWLHTMGYIDETYHVLDRAITLSTPHTNAGNLATERVLQAKTGVLLGGHPVEWNIETWRDPAHEVPTFWTMYYEALAFHLVNQEDWCVLKDVVEEAESIVQINRWPPALLFLLHPLRAAIADARGQGRTYRSHRENFGKYPQENLDSWQDIALLWWHVDRILERPEATDDALGLIISMGTDHTWGWVQHVVDRTRIDWARIPTVMRSAVQMLIDQAQAKASERGWMCPLANEKDQNIAYS